MSWKLNSRAIFRGLVLRSLAVSARLLPAWPILANASTPVFGLLTHLCRGVRSSERRERSQA